MYLQWDTPEQEPGQAFRGQHDLVALGRFVKFLVESPRRPRSHCVIELHAVLPGRDHTEVPAPLVLMIGQ